MTIKQIYYAPIIEVAEWADKEFFLLIPSAPETVSDLQEISVTMAKLSNQYSYLSSILSHMKYLIREVKGQGSKESKDLANELIDKREILDNAQKTVKQHLAVLSRMVTIKQEINAELKLGSYA